MLVRPSVGPSVRLSVTLYFFFGVVAYRDACARLMAIGLVFLTIFSYLFLHPSPILSIARSTSSFISCRSAPTVSNEGDSYELGTVTLHAKKRDFSHSEITQD